MLSSPPGSREFRVTLSLVSSSNRAPGNGEKCAQRNFKEKKERKEVNKAHQQGVFRKGPLLGHKPYSMSAFNDMYQINI